MPDRKDQQSQRGSQSHAEGGHGDKTHQAIIQQLNANGQRTGDQENEQPAPRAGKHKIHEDREQHDEADKNAEKNRLKKDLQRSGATGTEAGETPSTHGDDRT